MHGGYHKLPALRCPTRARHHPCCGGGAYWDGRNRACRARGVRLCLAMCRTGLASASLCRPLGWLLLVPRLVQLKWGNTLDGWGLAVHRFHKWHWLWWWCVTGRSSRPVAWRLHSCLGWRAFRVGYIRAHWTWHHSVGRSRRGGSGSRVCEVRRCLSPRAVRWLSGLQRRVATPTLHTWARRGHGSNVHLHLLPQCLVPCQHLALHTLAALQLH